MLPPAVERVIAPPFPEGDSVKTGPLETSPAVVLIAPVPPVTERVIFPPLAPKEEESRLPVVMLPSAVERVIAPPFPNSDKEEEFRLPVVMLPPAVERAIAPPFPDCDLVSTTPAVVLIAPVPLVTEKVMFPPSPKIPPIESTSPAEMLPPAVERAIAPPFPKRPPEAFKSPALVSIAPVPPVMRVISPAVSGKIPGILEVRFPVVILPPTVERAIAPPFPEVGEEEIFAATVLISLILVRVIFPPAVTRLALTDIALPAFNAIAPFPLLVID
jgi:hypothetical protein